MPPSEEVQAAVLLSIQPIAETLGLGTLEVQKYAEGSDFAKHWVLANQKPLFSIDLTRIGGGLSGHPKPANEGHLKTGQR